MLMTQWDHFIGHVIDVGELKPNYTPPLCTMAIFIVLLVDDESNATRVIRVSHV